MASAGRTACTGEHAAPAFLCIVSLVPSSDPIRLRMNTRTVLSTITVALLLGACAPSMDPLYRDFQRETPLAGLQTPALQDTLRKALESAGWEIAEESIEPAIRTLPRTHARWGFYRVTVYLEALPLGSRHVRVLIHPHREYVWGTRSKLPYLTRPIRQAIVPELERALSAHGLTMVEPERHGTR